MSVIKRLYVNRTICTMPVPGKQPLQRRSLLAAAPATMQSPKGPDRAKSTHFHQAAHLTARDPGGGGGGDVGRLNSTI